MKSFIVTMIVLGHAAFLKAIPLSGNLFSEFEDETCVDMYPKLCPQHRDQDPKNYCLDYEEYMKKHCRKTCGFCQPRPTNPVGPGGCEDLLSEALCQEHAANPGYCDYTNNFMKKYCPKTCNLCYPEPTRIAAPTFSASEFEWRTPALGSCESGVQSVGVECWHFFEDQWFQVDLRYCRQHLGDESEPAEERPCP